MKRIAVGGFLHETNSFAPSQDVDHAYFLQRRDRPPLLRGEEIRTQLAGASFPMTGFLRAIDARHALLPLVWASGGAGGVVSDDAFERITGELVAMLARAMPLDAVYLDLHGAMVTPAFDDPEGELLRRVRETVGPHVPVVVSLDYHANVSPAMAAHIDAAAVYRTYPHVDRVETGETAARLVERLLRRGGGRTPAFALRHLPFLIPLEAQCTLVAPSCEIVAQSLADAGPIASLCYAAGFPAADTHWCGPSVMAHADSAAQAEAACAALANHIARQEAAFHAPLWQPGEAVAEALRRGTVSSRPVILADIQDNPGAGASSDTTGLLEALLRARAPDAVLGLFHDPEAARAAHAQGEGARLPLRLGGRCSAEGVQPLAAECLVERLAPGRFRTTGTVAGGNEVDLGPMALLRLGEGVRVVVTSQRMQAFDPAPFHHVGVDPARTAILVLKSTCHFRADFEPMAQAVLNVLAPGDCPADPARLPYRRLRPDVRRRPTPMAAES